MAMRTAILAFILGLAATVPAAAQDQLIGYTPVVRNGAAGILVFNEDCDNAFPGVGAHICSSADFIRGNLPIRPGDPNANATNWIVPTVVGTVISGSVITVIDASGKTATPPNFTCDGWISAASTVTGLSANDKGAILPAACNGARNVACCAPAP